MAETANIAKMAEKLAKELFSEFLWKQTGPTNTNWACEDQEKHKKTTHPSDVVFYYDEPYSQSRMYVNVDLKSYAKGTITAANIRSALQGLAKAMQCVEKSDEWRERYIHQHVSPEICGMLFIYNHDGEYDKDFSGLLSQVSVDKLDLPKGSKVVVFGPTEVFWLNNVRHHIAYMRGGTEEIPDRGYCRFYYPHLVRKKNVQLESAKAATLEMITSPWIILAYTNPKKQNRKGYVVFYRRRGETVEEFLYLIDYLMHYQMLLDDTDVHIRMLNPDPIAAARFSKAKDQYVDEVEGGSAIKDRLDLISYGQMNNVVTKFSDIEIGME